MHTHVCTCLPVTSRWNEIQAAVDSSVRDHLFPINAHLFIEVFVKLFIHILQDGHPTIHVHVHVQHTEKEQNQVHV